MWKPRSRSAPACPKIMWRHLMPNTIAPLIVQGTMSAPPRSSTEAILSFLGAGVSPETPTWGNIMAEGRAYFQIKPSLIFWPGCCCRSRSSAST
jgi:peptide/nickel transport system permease protein